MNLREKYLEYLQSEHWCALRQKALNRDEFRCVICGEDRRLQVHHLRYAEDLREVPMGWLMTLCEPCHKMVHRYLKAEGQRIRYWDPRDARHHLVERFRGRFGHTPSDIRRGPCMGDERRKKILEEQKIRFAKRGKKKNRDGAFYRRNKRPKGHWK